MPALPPVPNVVKARLFWAVEGDPFAVTILHFTYAGTAPDESQLSDWITNVLSVATSNLAPEFLSSTTLESADARDLSSDMGATAEASAPAPGTRTGTRLAPGTCAIMNYKVKRTYRGGKPRSYFPFGASADVAATGLWADAFVTEYEDAVSAFLGACLGTFEGFNVTQQCQVSYYGPPNKVITSGSTGRMRTVSTRRDAPGGTGAPIVDLVNSVLGSKQIASQRRRNRNA